MKLISIISVGIIIIFLLTTGCTNNKMNTHLKYECQIQDYGNGILYFDCIDDLFATTLSNYISEHNVTVISISGANQGFYGEDKGNIVVVK